MAHLDEPAFDSGADYLRVILLQVVDARAKLHHSAVPQPLRKAFRERRRGQRAAIAREEELGYVDCASARCAYSRVAYTSAGSPAIGSAVGKRHLGRRDAGVGKGAR